MKLWLDTRTHASRVVYSLRPADAVDMRIGRDPQRVRDILEEIAAACDVTIKPAADGLAISTRLYPAASKRWQRTSASAFSYSENLGRNRLVSAVCWHGHYRFMSEVFARFPHAKIATGHAVYNGRADFNAHAEGTGDRNIGAPIQPIAFRDACTCEACGDDNPEAYDALSWAENDTPERALQRLQEDATSSAEWRGHRLGSWQSTSEGVAHADCQACEAGVTVNVKPPPNGIDIVGSAVAVNCPREVSHVA